MHRTTEHARGVVLAQEFSSWQRSQTHSLHSFRAFQALRIDDNKKRRQGERQTVAQKFTRAETPHETLIERISRVVK